MPPSTSSFGSTNSSGISNFGNKTSICAPFVFTLFDADIVPVYIERLEANKFKLKIFNRIKFSKSESLESITLSLNGILEKMIVLLN